ncbi:L-alanyl-gamma-D-glutamyl-L-diamino acid endopeptidase [Indibacter alkaliphilus LW1]|uniref:L-alanyl-gamma-D-glutamyl-L-diamino acid endopeptidase n=1 Tax=Indibacter alkaliphilus (strain CCUG 57479 / KCTC 22604 / LW1) TaxID=1189612 RepID=S2DKI5_INDAL|nr:C40 family peptidase [Indibacter alkaliphilus]EOZ97740.1 L-alanyl-gamma-D-glutamyl-L-diamino acid endopeptidase [Indibacter alkaliphilus LW1]
MPAFQTSKSFIPYLILIGIVFFACGTEENNKELEQLLADIKESYAPDQRVALWNVQLEDNKLVGETDQPDALEKLREALAKNHQNIVSNIQLLPRKDLEGKEQALVTISVANIRSAPKHSAELATQALMGTPIKVLKQDGSWYLIQTPDGYISWVDAAGIHLMEKDELEKWQAADKIVFTGLHGFVFEDPSKQTWISDLVAGNILEVLEENGAFLKVSLPDGRQGLVEKAEVMDFHTWKNTRELQPEKLIQTAKSMMGSPYLWGGTSIKGMDCSGFTKTIFFLHGQVIPRDASQQIHEGELVDDSMNWSQLEVGDLLFFGEKATADKKERIVHVGMWIGDNSFIHARGMVRISSFDKNSPNYDEYELNRYLRTKRIIGKDNPNISSVEKALNFPTIKN